MVDLVKSAEKQCPYCAETIKAAALKCRYCQSDLTDSTGSTESSGHEEAAAPPAPPVAEESWEGDDLDSIPPTDPDKPSFLASGRLTGILVALCLVLAGVAGYAWYAAENPGDGAAPDGVITSSQARDAGMAAATSLTEKVLGYDWKTLDADMLAAQAVMAPTFRNEYVKAMDGVKAQTVKNQVKLTASVVATSVLSASSTKVEALVFVNQVTTAKGSANQRVDQNRVRVTLTRAGGDWRVSKMDAF